MDPGRLVKISRDRIPPGNVLQDVQKENGATLSQIKTGVIAYNKEEKEFMFCPVLSSEMVPAIY